MKSRSSVKLSVVIPCFNAVSTIAEQLEALAVQEWDEAWEVVVADNGSDDGTLGVVEGYLGVVPSLVVVDASAHRGAAYARNVGVKAARGEFIVFCDADDVVAPGWLAAIGEALEEHPFVASRFDSERLNSPLLRKTRMNSQATGLRSYTYPDYLPHAGGCGLGVRRAVHELVGGFDESMMRLQDTDYCWRIQLAGIPLYFAADAVVYIRFRESLRDSFKQAFFYGMYNVLLYKRYRFRGMPPISWRRGVRAWARQFQHLPALFNSRMRSHWVRHFGWRLGRLMGSIVYHVMAL